MPEQDEVDAPRRMAWFVRIGLLVVVASARFVDGFDIRALV